MAKIEIKDVPEELYTAFVKYAAKKGLTHEEAINKALEKYVEKAELELDFMPQLVDDEADKPTSEETGQ